MHGRRLQGIAVAGLVAAGIAIGGCGGSDASGADSSAPLTKAQFVKQAKEICHEGLVEKDKNVTEALKQLVGNAPSVEAKEAVVEEGILPPYKEIVDGLGELGAPKGDEAKVQKIVEQYEAALQEAEANPSQALKKNPFEAADNSGEAYGLEGCVL